MGAPRGNRGFGSASPEQIAKYVKLHEHLDVTGEITGSVPYVPQGQVMMHDFLLLISTMQQRTKLNGF